MGKGKPTKCPVCRKQLSSGKALGGHMSKHKKAKARRAATMAANAAAAAAKNKSKGPSAGTPEARAMLKEIQLRLSPDHSAALVASVRKDAGTTASLPDALPRVCLDLLAAAKRKRDEATKLEVDAQSKVKAKRDEANELVRLAERIGHIL